jgi:hypothetical protein
MTAVEWERKAALGMSVPILGHLFVRGGFTYLYVIGGEARPGQLRKGARRVSRKQGGFHRITGEWRTSSIEPATAWTFVESKDTERDALDLAEGLERTEKRLARVRKRRFKWVVEISKIPIKGERTKRREVEKGSRKSKVSIESSTAIPSRRKRERRASGKSSGSTRKPRKVKPSSSRSQRPRGNKRSVSNRGRTL